MHSGTRRAQPLRDIGDGTAIRLRFDDFAVFGTARLGLLFATGGFTLGTRSSARSARMTSSAMAHGGQTRG